MSRAIASGSNSSHPVLRVRSPRVVKVRRKEHSRRGWRVPKEQPEVTLVVFEFGARWPATLAPRLSGRQGVCVLAQQPAEKWDVLFGRLLRRIRQLDQPIAELVWVASSRGGALDLFWAVRALEHISGLGLSNHCRLAFVRDDGHLADRGFEVASLGGRETRMAPLALESA